MHKASSMKENSSTGSWSHPHPPPLGWIWTLITIISVGPHCVWKGTNPCSQVGKTALWLSVLSLLHWSLCSCPHTFGRALTSSASGGQRSSTHKHTVHTQTLSLCLSFLSAQTESVCSASLHTHQYFKDTLTHSSLDETSLGRNLPVSLSLSLQHLLIRVFHLSVSVSLTLLS